jgi:hypothetical protein
MNELEDIRREMWGRMTAAHLVDGALSACERQPVCDQVPNARNCATGALASAEPNGRSTKAGR